MKKFKTAGLILSLISVACLLSANVYAAAGGDGLRFLTLGVGARATGMGGAFTAQADDESAGYWNPGGLAQLQNTELLTMYDSWLQGMSHIYLGLGSRLESGGVVSGQINYFSAGSIDATDAAGADIAAVDANDMSIGVSYAKETDGGLLLGGTLKTVSETLGSESGSGFGIDGGLLYKMEGGTNLGLTVQNLGASVKVKSDTIAAPTVIRGGISYNMAEKGTPLTINGDVGMEGASMDVGIGGEYMMDNVALRLGIENTSAGTNPCLGIGLNQGSVLFDLGMSMDGDLGSAFKISVIGRFGEVSGPATKQHAVSKSAVSNESAEVKQLKHQIREAMDAGDFDRANALTAKLEAAKKKSAAAAPVSNGDSAEVTQLKQQMQAAMDAGDFEKANMLMGKIKEQQAKDKAAATPAGDSAEVTQLKAQMKAAMDAGDFDKANAIMAQIKEKSAVSSAPSKPDNSAQIADLKKQLKTAMDAGDFDKANGLMAQIKELEK